MKMFASSLFGTYLIYILFKLGLLNVNKTNFYEKYDRKRHHAGVST